MSEDWDWEFTDSANRRFDALDEYARERISSKLDDIVTDQWREPGDYLEPLAGVPHQKLRIGPFRLGCRADHEQMVLRVLTIKKRGGDAYRSDDD
ncbi:type II toxin-antitoxin system RelE/ParE family toxin [Halomontanus rarus]|uniref:type II toxin-antitoxin system RelE/ParE family toxin n=1 Tax=Halomontanus rarus TaxID=3034020 RepID=UPI001A9A0110